MIEDLTFRKIQRQWIVNVQLLSDSTKYKAYSFTDDKRLGKFLDSMVRTNKKFYVVFIKDTHEQFLLEDNDIKEKNYEN